MQHTGVSFTLTGSGQVAALPVTYSNYPLRSGCSHHPPQLRRDRPTQPTVFVERVPNIAFWESSEKPPRSALLPKLAGVLGVSVEMLLAPWTSPPQARKRGPRSSLLPAFEQASSLPKRQQQRVEQFVFTLIAQRRSA